MSYKTRHEKLAYRIALQSQSKFRMGAILTKGSNVINVGVNNMYKTHPITSRYTHRPLGTHAEVSVCKRVTPEDIIGSTIYICRVLKNGKIAMAAPCECCMQILTLFSVRGVYFSTDQETFSYKRIS